jgi:branched-chain amino acid transport system substrate-binding protein
MQVKLKLTVAAAIAAVAGIASAQEQVVKIGHVAPVSGAQAHYGKDNENGVRMAIEDLNKQNITIGGKKIKFEI